MEPEEVVYGSEIIFKYFPDLSETQISQINKLQDLYSEWNEKINVVSRKDIAHLYERHVLHSLAISKFLEFKNGAKILDVGCGGGFPGIPLAILYSEVHFTLVDSIGKKILVVNEVAKALGLKNVNAFQARAESVSDNSFDFAISRAVAAFPRLLNWVKSKIKQKPHNHELKNGLICLKGGDLSEELKGFEKKIQLNFLSEYFEEPFFETKKVVYMATQ